VLNDDTDLTTLKIFYSGMFIECKKKKINRFIAETIEQHNPNIPATGEYKQIGQDGTSWLKIL